MNERYILVARQHSSFARVVASNLHSLILEIQVASSDWVIFERNLLEEYGLNGSSRTRKKDWVESHNKMLSASATLQKFKQRFDHLFLLDRTILDSNKVAKMLQKH